MENGRKIPYDQALAARIVNLREGGYTWKQIDALLFSGLQHKDKRSGSFAGDFCVKHKVEGVFSKRVIGYGTPTQIVIKIPTFKPEPSLTIRELPKQPKVKVQKLHYLSA